MRWTEMHSMTLWFGRSSNRKRINCVSFLRRSRTELHLLTPWQGLLLVLHRPENATKAQRIFLIEAVFACYLPAPLESQMKSRTSGGAVHWARPTMSHNSVVMPSVSPTWALPVPFISPTAALSTPTHSHQHTATYLALEGRWRGLQRLEVNS